MVTFRFNSEDTDLHHETTIIRTDPRGEVVAIHFNNRSIQAFYAEPEKMPAFYAAYHAFAGMLEDERFKVTFKMGPGDGVLFDNQRILHGRIGYQSAGDRHFQGCYADIDAIHEELGAEALHDHFPPEVIEPMRLHVAAKRYLAATDAEYLKTVSPASMLSLESS